jgi:hypothetical protein
MTTFYRGIKVTDENVSKETKKSNAGIYRGVKHGTIEKESATVKSDLSYRGIKH